jgi:hypothetical protein
MFMAADEAKLKTTPNANLTPDISIDSKTTVTNFSQTDDPSPPRQPVRLIFLHHSTGTNWLKDNNGDLGAALKDNNYFVSDTNYGWGPNATEIIKKTSKKIKMFLYEHVFLIKSSIRIGDHTDIGNWWQWFRGPESSEILKALYVEGGQHSAYSRLEKDPGGENEIVMFKSCFPNSGLQGDPNDPIPSIDNNPLRGQDSGSEYHTVANAKGIYIDLLEYFKAHQEKLSVVMTAPPLSDPTFSSNARAFNQWLVNEWLRDYPYNNVFVFDFYNIQTTNGGSPDSNDLNATSGNHHRWWNGSVQHVVDGDPSHNILAYPTKIGDDHPSIAGNQKATAEFIPLLNVAYHRWKA